jgi:methionyl aminopeptidase
MIQNNGMGYFILKDQKWLDNQRIAGKVLSKALSLSKELIIENTTTKFISDHIEEIIRFPAAACVSINNVIVHGIPNDYELKYGDVVKVDAGATYKGAIADAAYTVIVGSNSKYEYLMKCCEGALDKAIDYISNNDCRIGDIGYIMEKEAKKINASTLKDLTGHGLEENTPHWFPIILNYGDKGGIKIIPGMTFCIEPMFVYGSDKIKLLNDGWSIITEDVGVHFEHTIFIKEDGVEIITRNYD